MTQFLQTLAGGLSLGSIYVLLALGFVIIYRATSIVSFAQPAVMIFGTYWTVYFATVIGVNFWISVVLAAIIGAAGAALIERVVLRPLVGRPEFSAVMVTIGIDIVLRTITHDLIGLQQRQTGDPWGLTSILNVRGVAIAHSDIAAFVVAMVITTVLLTVYQRSRIGLAMRATSLDQEAAMAQGIPVGRMFGLAWALAGALAAVAGTFLASTGNNDLSQSTYVFALNALPVIILGGLDSIKGAVVGGFIIGIAQEMMAIYQPSIAPWLGENFSIVTPYAVMLLVLLVRPHGLFGTAEVRRV